MHLHVGTSPLLPVFSRSCWFTQVNTTLTTRVACMRCNNACSANGPTNLAALRLVRAFGCSRCVQCKQGGLAIFAPNGYHFET